jgi:hypothetical protein
VLLVKGYNHTGMCQGSHSLAVWQRGIVRHHSQTVTIVGVATAERAASIACLSSSTALASRQHMPAAVSPFCGMRSMHQFSTARSLAHSAMLSPHTRGNAHFFHMPPGDASQ